ncbi:hypothetical protein ACJJTC_015460 [Scirpophaga incertulas]
MFHRVLRIWCKVYAIPTPEQKRTHHHLSGRVGIVHRRSCSPLLAEHIPAEEPYQPRIVPATAKLDQARPPTTPSGIVFFINKWPLRRPKQSFASDALATVSEALSSIAIHDDLQCVPRLLCEAAGGGSVGSSNLLQSIANIQPFLMYVF